MKEKFKPYLEITCFILLIYFLFQFVSFFRYAPYSNFLKVPKSLIQYYANLPYYLLNYRYLDSSDWAMAQHILGKLATLFCFFVSAGLGEGYLFDKLSQNKFGKGVFFRLTFLIFLTSVIPAYFFLFFPGRHYDPGFGLLGLLLLPFFFAFFSLVYSLIRIVLLKFLIRKNIANPTIPILFPKYRKKIFLSLSSLLVYLPPYLLLTT